MSHLPTEQAKAEPAEPLGLYVHVPFCASTCDFCAFYQVRPTAGAIERFIAGVAREEGIVRRETRDGRRERGFATVFWGGGTPGLLAAEDLVRLGSVGGAGCPQPAGVRAACVENVVRDIPAPGRRVGGNARHPVEFTVELAPASVTPERLEALRAIGVTRVSLGVQSFQPALLDALGRQHSREQALRAYERIRGAGFQSVNLDLMFALPGQSEESWKADLREAIALQPDHLSTYCLTLEEDTALWLKLALLRQGSGGQTGKARPASASGRPTGSDVGRPLADAGRISVAGADMEADLYLATWDQLGAAGFAQYEISNFARTGHECRHNINTWHMHEWIGLGPSAASQQFAPVGRPFTGRRFESEQLEQVGPPLAERRLGVRGTNIADLDAWLKGLEEGRRMTGESTVLTPRLLAEDALVFGLRMNAGVDLEPWRLRAPDAPWPAVDAALERLAEEGLAEVSGGRAKLTLRGRLLADSIGAELMGAFDEVARVAPNAPACTSHALATSPASSRVVAGGLGESRATL